MENTKPLALLDLYKKVNAGNNFLDCSEIDDEILGRVRAFLVTFWRPGLDLALQRLINLQELGSERKLDVSDLAPHDLIRVAKDFSDAGLPLDQFMTKLVRG